MLVKLYKIRGVVQFHNKDLVYNESNQTFKGALSVLTNILFSEAFNKDNNGTNITQRINYTWNHFNFLKIAQTGYESAKFYNYFHF